MGPNDGLDYLLRAISYIVHELRRSDIQFVLVGGGDLQPVAMEMSRALGLNDCVKFAGRIPDEDVITVLSTADICVAPDPKDPLNDVSTMNKIVEYMALGKPVIAFDLREARVSAGDAALYAVANDPVDFGNKIVELLSSSEKRNVMGNLGRQRFETQLAWEHQSKKLVGLYHNLLGTVL
jgi:glycosyltransferase involved in cell wall biosynthesis